MIFANGLTYVVLFAAVCGVTAIVPQASDTVLKMAVVLMLAVRSLLEAANTVPVIAKVDAVIEHL